MNHIIPYDPSKTLMYPNGTVADPARILKDFPAVTAFAHVIETDDSETMCYAVMALDALKTNHGLDAGLSNEQAVVAINEIMRTPPPEPEPSAEERIAAALEYQNLLTLDDAPVGKTTVMTGDPGPMTRIQARYANYLARGLWAPQMLAVAARKGVMPAEMADAVITEVGG